MKLAKVKFGKVLKTVWPKSVNFWMRRVPTREMDFGHLMLILPGCLDFAMLPCVPSRPGKRGKGLREGCLCKDAEPERSHSPQNTARCSADQAFPSARHERRPEQLPAPRSAPGRPGAGPPARWLTAALANRRPRRRQGSACGAALPR